MPFHNGRPAPLRPIKGIQYGPNCQPDSGILSFNHSGGQNANRGAYHQIRETGNYHMEIGILVRNQEVGEKSPEYRTE